MALIVRVAKLSAIIIAFASLGMISWDFALMTFGYEVCAKEPRRWLAFIEFVTSGAVAVALLVLIKKEIKKK